MIDKVLKLFGGREFIEKNGVRVPKRPNWEDFFLGISADFSSRAPCLRRQFGAVITDTKNRVVSGGYCGAPRNVKNCIDEGYCYRIENKIPSGQNYEICVSLHAEENAMLFADDRSRLEGSILYIAGWDVAKGEPTTNPPCIHCAKMIIQVGIERVVLFSEESNIRTIQVSDLIEKISKRDFSYPY